MAASIPPRGTQTPASLVASLIVGGLRLLAPLCSFAMLLGLLLSAVAIVLDAPVGQLLDAALNALPSALHAMQLLPHPPTAGLVLPPFVRSLVLVPLRLPSVLLLGTLLYLTIVPGLDVLVRARTGFEMGYRAVTSSAPSNTAGGASDADERLAAVLATWGRLITMVRAARLAALGIAALALIDRAGTLHTPKGC